MVPTGSSCRTSNKLSTHPDRPIKDNSKIIKSMVLASFSITMEISILVSGNTTGTMAKVFSFIRMARDTKDRCMLGKGMGKEFITTSMAGFTKGIGSKITSKGMALKKATPLIKANGSKASGMVKDYLKFKTVPMKDSSSMGNLTDLEYSQTSC
jgi:hypothetical protein